MNENRFVRVSNITYTFLMITYHTFNIHKGFIYLQGDYNFEEFGGFSFSYTRLVRFTIWGKYLNKFSEDI